MIMEVSNAFSFKKKKTMDSKNSKAQEWKTLIWKYQQALPMSRTNEKWRLMEQIFQLD